MKKFIKSCLCLALAFTAVFSLTACKDKLSQTTTDTSNVKTVNEVSTNGGMTVVHNDYLYFINGTKTNDGTSLTNNKRAAICRVKYDVATGEVNKDTYEVVVSDLVGFKNASLYFFGDFMYYATPSGAENYKGEVLYNKTRFMRYDLVNKKSHEIYTTVQNSAEEVVSYSYFIVSNTLNLVVYEKTNATITSLKIDDEVSTNYVISEVSSCVMSENFGTCVTAGKTVDANNFVFYTLAHELTDSIQTGVKVYRTSPVSNTSELICNNGEEVSLLAIRNGKLLYSVEDIVYASAIESTRKDLTFTLQNIISYLTYENVIFMENEDGSISLLSYNKDTYQVVVFTWKNGVEIENNTINVLSKAEKFEFVTLATIDEVVVEDDEETTDVDETKTEKVQFLVYIADSIIYKLEVARENSQGKLELVKHTQPIKLSATKVESSNGLLIPEVIGNYLFVMAQDDNKIVYMHKIDMSVKETSTDKATFIGIAE